MNRINDFHQIIDSISNEPNIYLSDDLILINDDSLKVLSLIPSHSVGLILTDPPYHSTKKNNITNDKSFSTDKDYLDWMSLFFHEWKRILRPNGSLFLFCSSAMESKLQNRLEKEFNILSNIVWTKPNAPGFDGWKQKMKKEALRQWYPQSERIIFAEPAFEGNLTRSYFANFLKESRKKTGISAHFLAEEIGAFGKINHGGTVSNWETGRNIPSREQYHKILTVLKKNGLKELPDYEDVIRPCMVNSNVEFTDIWTFPSVHPHKGKHPAEKPIEMLKHAILATTFEGDIILDCFAGSGNSGIAANELNRKVILIEIEKKWYQEIKDKFLSDGLFTLSMAHKKNN